MKAEMERAYKEMTLFLMSYGNVLRQSPHNSMTPFPVLTGAGKEELIFVVKTDSGLYQDLVDYHQGPIELTMYEESNDLILRFDVLDLYFESQIEKAKTKGFLQTLNSQEYIT